MLFTRRRCSVSRAGPSASRLHRPRRRLLRPQLLVPLSCHRRGHLVARAQPVPVANVEAARVAAGIAHGRRRRAHRIEERRVGRVHPDAVEESARRAQRPRRQAALAVEKVRRGVRVVAHCERAPHALSPLHNGVGVVGMRAPRPDGCACAESLSEQPPALVRFCCCEDARPRRLEAVLARVARAAGGRRIERDGLVEGVVVVRRREARERPDGCGGGDGARDGVGVVHAEPGGEHAAVRAAKADERRLARAPLLAQVRDQVGKIGHRLLAREEVHALRCAGGVRQGRAVVPVLGKDQQRAELGRALPHEPCVVHIKLNIVLVPEIEEDRRVLLPKAIVYEVSLLVSSMAVIAKRRRPVEMVYLLFDPMHGAVRRTWAARE
mmetsp:Transcript_26892/g.52262  ORF Transcript_26892/g.52262 Transcript_26892/m.52262 type:complete len:381 (-) Transcript_26892:251-1393(-)